MVEKGRPPIDRIAARLPAGHVDWVTPWGLIMTIRALALSVLGLGLCVSTASADFVFSNSRVTVGSGTSARDRVSFYALNDNTGYSAGSSRLMAMELNAASTGTISFAPNAFGTLPDMLTNLTMSQANLVAGNATTTRIMSELFGIELLSTIPPHPNPDGSFYALGADLSSGLHGVLANSSVNGGKGAAFLTVVTTPGATISLSGGIADENGGIGGLLTLDNHGGFAALDSGLNLNPFSYVAAVPEPVSLVSMAGLALVAGRRTRR